VVVVDDQTEVALVARFSISLATETVAEVALTVGVVMKAPLNATWTGLSVVSQTLR
jgi:hypothetical protein